MFQLWIMKCHLGILGASSANLKGSAEDLTAQSHELDSREPGLPQAPVPFSIIVIRSPSAFEASSCRVPSRSNCIECIQPHSSPQTRLMSIAHDLHNRYRQITIDTIGSSHLDNHNVEKLRPRPDCCTCLRAVESPTTPFALAA